MAGYGTDEEKQLRAQQAIIGQMRKDAGITDDMWTTASEMKGFMDVMKKSEQGIVTVYDKEPDVMIFKGMNAVPAYRDGYKEAMGSLSTTPAESERTGKVEYNLHVDVTGLEDVGNQVAQTAARKILDSLPYGGRFNVSYGG